MNISLWFIDNESFQWENANINQAKANQNLSLSKKSMQISFKGGIPCLIDPLLPGRCGQKKEHGSTFITKFSLQEYTFGSYNFSAQKSDFQVTTLMVYQNWILNQNLPLCSWWEETLQSDIS